MLRRGAETARRRTRALVALLGLAAAAGTLAAVPQASAVSDRALHGRVTVGVTGNGEGRITSTPDGIDCGSRCSFSFISNDEPDKYQPVTLRATASPGSVFGGFGECGKNECTIDPIEPGRSYEVLVQFTRVAPSSFALTVGVTGQGRVTSSPGGIDCGPTCSHSFSANAKVTLNATPVPGWTFSGWGGACSGTEACTLTVSKPLSVSATFAPPGTAYALAVVTAGGVTSSDIPGISCGESCVADYGAGVEVTLTPSGSPVAWAGACSGSGACVIPMTRARAVTAAIGGARPSLVPVAVAVSGTGTVTSAPAGINCGTECGARLPLGSRITLRAAPGPGWVFSGWTGSCRGVDPRCTLTGRAPASAGATFVEATTRFPVAVTKAGQGTITSAPAGIRCGSRCSAPFPAGQVVRLEAEPREGWSFVRWSGACASRKKTCTLGMDGPKSLSATFGRPSDRTPPRVTALPVEGEVGETVRLRYRVSDRSGRSRETATVYAGQRRLAVIRGRFHSIDPSVLYYIIPWPNAVAPATRFCITSTDPTGNTSKPSCAPLRIS